LQVRCSPHATPPITIHYWYEIAAAISCRKHFWMQPQWTSI
jgi:hypothetical protein